MENRYSQIKFLTANYSKLQGLRAIPVGILCIFVAVWDNTRQGQLDGPLVALVATLLLYWLIDIYYNRVFGQVKQTPQQRRRDAVISIVFCAAALLAFAFDTAQILPVSLLGLVFAAGLFVDWQTTRSNYGEKLTTFFENFIASILILIVSILPLIGISWWEGFGIKSQMTGVFLVVGAIIILTGLWGHVRISRALSTAEKGSNDNAL